MFPIQENLSLQVLKIVNKCLKLNVSYRQIIYCCTVHCCQVVSVALDSTPADLLHAVAVALLVNLALNSRCAEMMSENGSLQYFIERAFHYQNSILMKIVRNISVHNNTKMLFIVSIHLLL